MWLLLLVVALLVLYPLLTTVVRTFVVDGHLNTKAFYDAAHDQTVLPVLTNTGILVLAGGMLAVCVGSLLAWLSERTDAHLGSLTDVLPLAPLLVPPIAGVTGWVVLLHPRIGLLNGALRGVIGLTGLTLDDGPANIYTFPGLILVTALYLVPYTYLVVSAALRNLDPSLEEASRIGGAGPWQTLRQVTVPAIAPALGAAAVLTLFTGITIFTVPLIIGTGARIDVLSVDIYRLLLSSPPRTDIALLLSGLMLIVVQGGLILQNVLAPSGQHATIGGRGFRANRVELGSFRVLARAAMVLYLLLTSIIPLLGLLLISVQRYWTPDIKWNQLTLDNYQIVLLQNPVTSHALLNSILLGAVGATLGMLIAALLMWYTQQSIAGSRRLVDILTAMPATIPHTVIGVSFLYAFSQPPLRLYGTWLLLLLAYLTMFLPQATRAASSAVSSVGRELSEASHVFGASAGSTFARILLPLAVPGLLAGWVILFVHMVGELTVSALLSGQSNLVVGRVLLDLWENGSFPQLAAMAMIMSFLDSTLVLIVLRQARLRFNVMVA